MRLAINATSLRQPLTGLGNYTYNLLNVFYKSQDITSIDLFYGSSWSRNLTIMNESRFEKLRSFVRDRVPGSYNFMRFLMQSAFDKKINQNDLYHEPNFLSFKSEIPAVISVHDLSWIRYPEFHPKSRVLAMNKFFARGLKDAQRIIVDSGYIKNEIIDLLGYSIDKIDVIPLGFSSHFIPRKRDEISGVLNQFGLKYQDYFLLVGTIEPRKNIITALNAFLKLPRRIRQKTPLVIVGVKGWLSDGFLDSFQPLIRGGEVIILGYLNFEDLVFMYAGAKALIFPSVYEGFGLPPLEAMACGIPVIASNTSSVPEVVGEAGILIDPFDADMFAEAMMNLADDISFREMLAEKSLTRSQLFSWDSCAEKTISTYKKVLHN